MMLRNDQGIVSMPQSLTNLSELHCHKTRSQSQGNYHIPSARTNQRKTAFSYMGPKIWYDVPHELKSLPPFLFKNKYKAFLIQDYNRN